MAQKVQIILTDDLDGGPADETVKFGLDGGEYEIDLSTDNAAALRDFVEAYRAAGRKLSRSGKPFRKVATGPDPRAVRAWAESHGIECSPRGRVPASVTEQYEAARGGDSG